MEPGAEGRELCGRKQHQRLGQRGVVHGHVVDDHALDAPHGVQAADAGDVGRLGRPRGEGARPGSHDLGEAGDGGAVAAGAVGEELFEDGALRGGQIPSGLNKMDELGAERADGQGGGGEILEELGEAEGGEGR